MLSNRISLALLATAMLAAGCDQTGPSPGNGLTLNNAKSADLPYGDGPVSPILDSINRALRARGLRLQVARAEYVLAPTARSPASGQVIFANDREKRLSSRWVPGDERRLADGDRLTWLNVDPFMAANTAAGPLEVTPSVEAAFGTWDEQQCSSLDIVERQWGGTTNPSILLDLGGLPVNLFEADISVIGFLPGEVFDSALGPGSSENVLGVTFTIVFTDGAGNPTDIDRDGMEDTALKEMWFNNDFTWTTSGLGTDIDVETVVLHESGHAVELGHFGKIFGTLGNLTLHVAPRAVMNAIILGTLRSPLGTDNAAFCGKWASWPK